MDNPHCVGTVGYALNTIQCILSKELYVNQNAFIKYDPAKTSIDKIKKIIKNAGYEPIEASGALEDTEKIAREKEIRKLKLEVIAGFLLSIPIFILSFPEWISIELP